MGNVLVAAEHLQVQHRTAIEKRNDALREVIYVDVSGVTPFLTFPLWILRCHATLLTHICTRQDVAREGGRGGRRGV